MRPTGNAVNLEDEMMKVAANQMDYQAVTALYTRSLASAQDRARQGLTARAVHRGREGGHVDFLKTMAIAASGLRAQAGRMRIISENIANADSTPASPGARALPAQGPTFSSEIDRALDAHVVELGKVAHRQFRFPV